MLHTFQYFIKSWANSIEAETRQQHPFPTFQLVTWHSIKMGKERCIGAETSVSRLIRTLSSYSSPAYVCMFQNCFNLALLRPRRTASATPASRLPPHPLSPGFLAIHHSPPHVLDHGRYVSPLSFILCYFCTRITNQSLTVLILVMERIFPLAGHPRLKPSSN